MPVDDELVRQIGRHLTDEPSIPGLALHQAVIVTVQTSTVTVTLDGSTTQIANVHGLTSYTPVAGDTVWVLRNGTDLLVIGKQIPGGGVDYSQHASTVQAYATGGMTVNFPTAFPNNLVSINVTPGDSAGSLCQCQIVRGGGATDRTKFKVACFTNTGVEVTNATNIRVDWIAWGN